MTTKTSHTEEECFQVNPEKKRGFSCTPSANKATITGRVLSTLATKGNDSGKPILDDGASHTMINHRSLFNTYQPQIMEISVANGQVIKSAGISSVKGIHQGEYLTLNNCLHVPDLKLNLVGMGDLAAKGCAIQFKDNGKFEVTHNNELALSGSLAGGVMELDLDLGQSMAHTALSTKDITNGHLLHSRLGHPRKTPLAKVIPGVSPPPTMIHALLPRIIAFLTKEAFLYLKTHLT